MFQIVIKCTNLYFYPTEKMDLDDILITTLVYLDDCGEIQKWCNKAMKITCWENVRLTPEGTQTNIKQLITARLAKQVKVIFSQACVTPSLGGEEWTRDMVTTPPSPPGPGHNTFLTPTRDYCASGRYASYWKAFLFSICMLNDCRLPLLRYN